MYRKRMSLNPKWRDKQLLRLRLWKRKHKDRLRIENRNWYYRVRLEALQAYSGKFPKCACCEDSNLEFLAVDHIDGNGGKHRRELRSAGRGSNFFLWLKRNKFPKGFRILCHNCNFSIGRYGYCPHNKLKLKTK